MVTRHSHSGLVNAVKRASKPPNGDAHVIVGGSCMMRYDNGDVGETIEARG